MKRAKYLLGLLDARDRLALGGVLVALLVMAGGVGWVSAAHRGREAREVRCRERVRQDDARWRSRGLQVMRLAMPCQEAR